MQRSSGVTAFTHDIKSTREKYAPIAHEQEDSLPLPFVHEPRRNDPHESKYPAGWGDIAPAPSQKEVVRFFVKLDFLCAAEFTTRC